MEISDDLKSNFRSWETDCDNAEDTQSLANILSCRYPEMSSDKIYEIAKDWTGFNEVESNEETN